MHYLKKVLLLTLVCIAPALIEAQTKKLNFVTELQRLHHISDLPKYMEGSVVKQFSSYDRKGGNNDGFEGTFSFIRKEEDGLVVFETKGPGVIERLWTPTPTEDTLDFYMDGSPTPSFSIKFNDLYSGKVYPFVPPLVARHKVGGYYSYLPIPYSNGCKIVFRGPKLLFYQFQYREYDPSKFEVASFNPKQMNAGEERALAEVVALWSYDNRSTVNFYGRNFETIATAFELRPGQSQTLAHLQSGGRILGIEIDPANVLEGLQKQIDLKITWDNEPNAAVYLPAADFFGCAFGQRSMRSLLVGVNKANKAYSYIPMPFDWSAKIELVYRNITGAKPVNIVAKVLYSNQKRNAAEEGKFYAYWKRENPALGKPYVFLEGNGKGHYVGTILQSQATDYTTFTEFFEGDDQTYIDGEMTIHGTGSEDYFNGGWYAQPGGWVERLGGPVSGCLDYSLPLSRTGGYRFFINDKMPFNKSIHHNMEHGPEKNNRPVDYSSVALYYANEPLAKSMTVTNTLATVPKPEKYSFYTRLMDHLSYDKDLKMTDGSAVFNGTNGILKINVEELPAGKYNVLMHPNLDVNEPWSVLSSIPAKTNNLSIQRVEKGKDHLIGTVEVLPNKAPVEIQFTSKSKAKVSFDRIMLVPGN